MSERPNLNFFWFRRDLRVEDNRSLFEALKGSQPIIPLFIFDKDILDKLEDRDDKRVNFLHEAIQDLSKDIEARGGKMMVRYGKPLEIWEALLSEFNIGKIYTNEDYEPYARKRDEAVKNLAEKNGASFHAFKDSVIRSAVEVLKDDGKPYTVFTPFKNKYRATLEDDTLEHYPSEDLKNYSALADGKIPSLESMGFEKVEVDFPSKELRQSILTEYADKRNIPGIQGTSRLGVHLRFGTIGIRALGREAFSQSEVFFNELIWRDFYQMILWHFPHVETKAFRPAYDMIPWRKDEEDFEKWREGRTGYPIVDAGMRELNETGFMHNRVRMIVASFLTKHLLLDWRWGEAWFARKLLDFDLASNNGGWQWASGSGTDAAPYFRIFNPESQTKKFDPKGDYIRQWVPEISGFDYPSPMVDHKFARERALSVYKEALNSAK